MDNQKDIEKTAQLGAFFEHYSVRTNPFGINQSAHRTYRRAERVVAALYLITNHVPDTEPLKSAIRAESIKLLAHVMDLKEDMRTKDSPAANACRVSIRQLASLVRMLSVGRLLSIQNANTATDGLDELGNFIDTSKSAPLSESVVLSREDFLDTGRVPLKDIKDVSNIRDNGTIRDTNRSSSNGSISSALSVREQNVLGVLTGAGELGIRDISISLPEYSEKMIQRELASLVAAGRVKKTGLKRWSRYSVEV